MPIGNNSACSASVTAGAAAGGLPDEPPDARPACPVVWEGAGQPRPLPDSPSRGERGACYARRRSEAVEGGRGELAQRGQDPSSPERFALGSVSPSRGEKGACYA